MSPTSPDDFALERTERAAIQAESARVPPEREALGWARSGHPVIPLWWPEPDASCGCGRPHPGNDSRNIGKHPIDELVPRDGDVAGTGGVSKATTDPTIIRSWFWKFPEANYGIRVGERFIVLDFDSDTSLARFKRALATLSIPLPVTITVRTGRGIHIWLSVPEGAVVGRPDFVETMKHGNAYVVGPGSLHVGGRVYERITPRGTPIARCPAPLLEQLTRRGRSKRAVSTGGLVPVNSRHDTWMSFAAHLHNMGLSTEQKVPIMLTLRDVAFECPADKTDAEALECARWYERKEASKPVTKGTA